MRKEQMYFGYMANNGESIQMTSLKCVFLIASELSWKKRNVFFIYGRVLWNIIGALLSSNGTISLSEYNRF